MAHIDAQSSAPEPDEPAANDLAGPGGNVGASSSAGGPSDARALERAVFRGLLIFSCTVLAIWAFGLILAPFLVPIAWALCLGAITAPFYRRLAARWRRPKLAALVMVLIVAIVILGPIVFLGAMVIVEATQLDLTPIIEEAKSLPIYGRVDGWLQNLVSSLGLPPVPKGEDATKHVASIIEANAPEVTRTLFAGPLTKGALSLIRLPFVFVFELLMVLVTLYFIYCESSRLLRLATDLSPLEPYETDLIFENLRGTTAAAILGGVVVALVQGLLGALMFWIAGVNSPLLWGMIMAGCSLLPFGGTALVWAPVGIFLLLTGDTGWGVFILAFGAVIVGSADNVLRPWLLSKSGASDIHPMMLFFAILSGIGIFGISGIVFGPLLLALLTTMLRIYRWHFSPSAGAADTEGSVKAQFENKVEARKAGLEAKLAEKIEDRERRSTDDFAQE